MRDKNSPLHHFYRRVENLTIPITVIRCDLSKRAHTAYLFTIFHRLNTGGLKLNNQEIRNCIYGGTLNVLLRDLDNFPRWRKLNRMKPNESYRYAKQEMILRFFAFIDDFENYGGQLAKFFNDYMHNNQNADNAFIERKRSIFQETVTIIYDKIFEGTVPIKIPVTHMEAVLVSVGRNLDTLRTKSTATIRSYYDMMVSHSEFSETSLREGLSKTHKVQARLNTAIAIFSGTSNDQ